MCNNNIKSGWLFSSDKVPYAEKHIQTYAEINFMLKGHLSGDIANKLAGVMSRCFRDLDEKILKVGILFIS